ncbi:MAG TPA: hypothetical protein VNJ07_07535 [Chitinophagales bacterium]|nr:hypothetical protein [Chitinophagales bacterium]
MLFNTVIGQQELKRKLIDSARHNTVSHAQLFLGPLGHGGLPLALAFSQYLNCEKPGDNDSCGICPSCVKAQKFIHPDIHYSFPFPKVEKKERCDEFIHEWRDALAENPYLDLFTWMARFEAENKQPNITIKECHDLIRKLSLKAFESPYKIVILWLPEYLGKEGNSLLKIIEEPPDRTVFILVAENSDEVLPTILSRTQIVKIPHIEHSILAEALQQKFETDSDAAFRLATISNGDYIEASRQIQHAFGELSELFVQWFTLCFPSEKTRSLEIYAWIEKFAAIGRENQKSFLKYAMHFLRETLYMQATENKSLVLTPVEHELASRLVKFSDYNLLQELHEQLNEAHFHAERNAHPKMLMMSLSLKVAGLLKSRWLQEV